MNPNSPRDRRHRNRKRLKKSAPYIGIFLLILMGFFTAIPIPYQDAISSIAMSTFLSLLFTLLIFLLYVLVKRTMNRSENWVKQGARYETVSKNNGKMAAMGLETFKVKYSLERLADNSFHVDKGTTTLTVERDFAAIENFSFNSSNIRWLGNRRGAYVVLDIEIDGWWYVLRIEGPDTPKFIDTILSLCPDDVSGARYRRRPDIRSRESKAFVSAQNLQGIWKQQESVELVITPLWFLVFHQGAVLHQVRIDSISNIHCAKHPTALDDAALLLTFEAEEGQLYHYEIYDEAFVTRLTNATRESIDNEPLRKKKAKGE